MRRGASFIVVAVGVALLLGSYIVYTQSVVVELRREAERSARMYARVYEALNDTSASAVAALFDLSRHISESKVPVLVTDADGNPTDAVNTPYDGRIRDPALRNDPALREYIARLDRQNEPIVEEGVGTVHIGDTPLVKGLRIIPLVQAGTLALILLAAIYGLRTRERADREKVWAGMARESAHQLGTPLSSLSGWLELLGEHEGDPMTAKAIGHMRGDLDRLERVAHRFERIGRPPRRDPVDVRELVEHVGGYFRARVPTLAHAVEIAASGGDEPLIVHGDAVLLEWALEALMKNAVDALAGRGGRIYITSTRVPEGVRIRVADDGPGIPRELRARVFDPGFSTKDHGWGVGLSLARRIIEENHRGELALVPAPRGATFDVILH
ncbi:MAG: ATP-binding region ATPase domain protein [Geminicoccaceae bacterium]|nr:ATP-binding region ATPase domain protein [Geminicoccaceae bacterium]